MPRARLLRGGWTIEARGLRLACLGALLPFVLAVAVGFTALYGTQSGGGGTLEGPLGDTGNPLFVAIALRNIAVALSLFAGALTAGVGTVVGIAFQGFLIGASTAAAATEVGFASAFSSVIGYAAIEVPALLLAAVAGLLPVATMVAPADRTATLRPWARFLFPLGGALTLLAAALLLLLLGAAVETVVITTRGI